MPTIRKRSVKKAKAKPSAHPPKKARSGQDSQSLQRALDEALARESATSEILRGMARSPMNIQPVLDRIAEKAARLCGADDAVIRMVSNNSLYAAAHFGSIRMATELGQLDPIESGGFAGRAAEEGRTLHV